MRLGTLRRRLHRIYSPPMAPLTTSGDDTLEEKTNPLLRFLSYFWGLVPWLIEIAAILRDCLKSQDVVA